MKKLIKEIHEKYNETVHLEYGYFGNLYLIAIWGDFNNNEIAYFDTEYYAMKYLKQKFNVGKK